MDTTTKKTCVPLFPNTPQLIPDSQRFANPLSNRVKQFSEPELGFSHKMHKILATLAAPEQKRIHAKAHKSFRYQSEAKALLNDVFSNCSSYVKLKSDIFICFKTGSSKKVVNTLKKVSILMN